MATATSSAPPAGHERKPAVSVLLLAGPAGGWTLDEYAQTLPRRADRRRHARRGAAGRPRQGLRGSRSAGRRDAPLAAPARRRATGSTGCTRQGEAAALRASSEPALDEMEQSFTLERRALYTEERERRVRASPCACRRPGGRRARSRRRHLPQAVHEPALGMDKGGQTVHASLTLTVEHVPAGGDRRRLLPGDAGEARRDLPAPEPHPVEGRLRRRRCARRRRWRSRAASASIACAEGRGYTLAFEARDDVYPRVSRWCDMIAATLEGGRGDGAEVRTALHAARRRPRPAHPRPGCRGDGRRPRRAAGQPARPRRGRRALGGPHRPGPALPDPRRGVLLPVLRAARRAARPLPGRGLGRGRVLRRPLRPVPRAVRLHGPRRGVRRPLQAGRAALGAGDAAGLRRFRRALFPLPDFDAAPHPEPGRVVPARVPAARCWSRASRSPCSAPADAAALHRPWRRCPS